jgi:ABC-type multidrug transport system fused ATPase/permease subunit
VKYADGCTLLSILQFFDIFLYTFLAWYFSQVWYSKVGVAKPWYFIFLPSYWLGTSAGNRAAAAATTPAVSKDADGLRIGLVESTEWKSQDSIDRPATASPVHGHSSAAVNYNLAEAVNVRPTVPIEPTPEHLFGQPTVCLDRLRKSFATQVAVNDLSLNMYENQIFALLGHNGAGKTTTINMLTGLMPPDSISDGGASVYGNDLHRNMDNIRQSMGVCPQHDVLFDHLSVKETIIFFSQLKV